MAKKCIRGSSCTLRACSAGDGTYIMCKVDVPINNMYIKMRKEKISVIEDTKEFGLVRSS